MLKILDYFGGDRPKKETVTPTIIGRANRVDDLTIETIRPFLKNYNPEKWFCTLMEYGTVDLVEKFISELTPSEELYELAFKRAIRSGNIPIIEWGRGEIPFDDIIETCINYGSEGCVRVMAWVYEQYEIPSRYFKLALETCVSNTFLPVNYTIQTTLPIGHPLNKYSQPTFIKPMNYEVHIVNIGRWIVPHLTADERLSFGLLAIEYGLLEWLKSVFTMQHEQDFLTASIQHSRVTIFQWLLNTLVYKLEYKEYYKLAIHFSSVPIIEYLLTLTPPDLTDVVSTNIEILNLLRPWWNHEVLKKHAETTQNEKLARWLNGGFFSFRM